MQQGLEIRSRIKVAGFLPEYDIGQERGAGGDMLTQALVFVGEQRKPPANGYAQQHQQQRGKNALYAARIEIRKTERAASDSAENNARYQVAGNDKENVDANEATRQPSRKIGRASCR